MKNQEICKKGWTCIYITYVVIDRLKNVAPPRTQAAHPTFAQRQAPWSPVSIGCRRQQYGWQVTNDPPMSRLSWPYVVCEIVKSSEVKGLTPLVMDTYEPRHGYLQAQAMDTYKLKWCVSTIRNKFHLPHTLDFLDIHHFRWGRSWMSSGDGTSSSPFSHLIRLPARKLLAERSPVTGFCICKGMTTNGYWQSMFA